MLRAICFIANRRVIIAERRAVEAEKRAIEAEKRAIKANIYAIEAGEHTIEAGENAIKAEKRAVKAELSVKAEKNRAVKAEKHVHEAKQLTREITARASIAEQFMLKYTYMPENLYADRVTYIEQLQERLQLDIKQAHDATSEALFSIFTAEERANKAHRRMVEYQIDCLYTEISNVDMRLFRTDYLLYNVSRAMHDTLPVIPLTDWQLEALITGHADLVKTEELINKLDRRYEELLNEYSECIDKANIMINTDTADTAISFIKNRIFDLKKDILELKYEYLL